MDIVRTWKALGGSSLFLMDHPNPKSLWVDTGTVAGYRVSANLLLFVTSTTSARSMSRFHRRMLR